VLFRSVNAAKAKIEELSSGKEAIMQRMRPLLVNFDNLSKDEGKFTAEFLAEGFKHRFLSFPKETVSYKALYEESFRRLSGEMQDEVNKLKASLTSVTAQEQFKREQVEKSDKWSEVEGHLKKINDIKAKMIELFKKIKGKFAKSFNDNFVILEK
jgi:hypothetical protein